MPPGESSSQAGETLSFPFTSFHFFHDDGWLIIFNLLWWYRQKHIYIRDSYIWASLGLTSHCLLVCWRIHMKESINPCRDDAMCWAFVLSSCRLGLWWWKQELSLIQDKKRSIQKLSLAKAASLNILNPSIHPIIHEMDRAGRLPSIAWFSFLSVWAKWPLWFSLIACRLCLTKRDRILSADVCMQVHPRSSLVSYVDCQWKIG